MRRLAAIAITLFALAVPQLALGQEPAEGESLMDVLARATQLNESEQRSFLVQFVEDRISTPDRQIRLNGINGALSSNASIDQITISDTEGIWLIIENAALTWDQGALVFGRLEIQSLSADSIAYIRNPVSTEEPAAPSPEAGGFSVPEFPVAVILESLSIPSVRFGEQVFGLGSEISLAGAMTLEGGAIDAQLDIERRDGPGGSLDLDLQYANESREIDLGLNLIEPENGIIANLLNIQGRPEIALGLTGAGQIENLDVELTFDADGNRILSGTGTLDQGTEGLMIAADLQGPLADILPAVYSDFFGTNTALSLNALLRDAGGFEISDLSLTGGSLSLFANAATTQDGFLNRLDISGQIDNADEAKVVLPVPGASTRLESAHFNVDYGTDGSEDWAGQLEILGFETPDFGADSLVLNASGVAADLEDPANRRVTFNGDGMLDGVVSSSEEISQALGFSMSLGIAGLWEAGQPITLAQLILAAEALDLEMAGQIADAVFTGDINLSTQSIAPFSGLAGRELSGAVMLAANGTLSPLIGGFDLTLDGTGTDLAVDDPVADNLLEGTVDLSGRIARSEAGLEARDFRIANDQVELVADGTYATGEADFTFEAALADLALIDPEASGRLVVTGTAQGSEGTIALVADADIAEGMLAGRTLRNANIGFDGISNEDGLVGTLAGSASLDGFNITLSSGIDNSAERLLLSDIAFEAPGTTLSGDLTRYADGPLEGRLTLDAPNIETAAALALVEASGSADADIVLTRAAETQEAEITAALEGIVFGDISVGDADARAVVADLFGVPVIDGSVTGSQIVAAGTTVETLDLTASSSGAITRFSGSAALNGGTGVNLAGLLEPIEDGYRVALDSFRLAQGELSASLAQPAELTVAGEAVSFSGIELAVGSGRISATGSAGQTLDIDLVINALPLNIANTVVPDLGLAGTVSGNAQISGEATAPNASFTIDASGINANAIADYGIAPLSLSARGRFADGTVTLAQVRAAGSGGLNATAQGTIPLSGSGLNIAIDGSAPLSLANRFVADRGAQVSGNATFNARVTGRLDNPQFGGTVSVANGEYIDPGLALRLVGITGSATLSAERATINSLTADLATGGSVSASGYVGLDAGLTSDIGITFNEARYADGYLVVATLNGAIRLSGPIANGGTLGGNIDIERADITVPDGFGGAVGVIDVDHVRPPSPVAATLARARIDQRASSAGTPTRPLALNLTISAPNQVFIRGRGLDAEVGGAVQLGGTIADIQPVGGLELIRGRLSILGQRIDFDEGSVTLIGDMDPFINLVARTEGNDITVIVTVSGRASAPEVTFTSDPMLPQDEVLSRLIFDRSVGDLSPLQLAQLAAAAAELAGGGSGSGSLLGSLREAAGLDDLDIVTDEEGNAAVRAGAYIDDNIYLGVETGTEETRVTIDLEVTEQLRARASTSTNGNSGLGVFYEQDY
ncbi:translocation/assembly module TamB domain-containing protein [Pelagibacterium sp. H642]|uniref:translocation/assembly module TamB domain-containing protein n=1 Tax=Pelagibacterium sp. H642 TaxID=1881069 RepID=UPI002816542E|nr:translocation/assembly module TamB domain-containing protein [Pelagibacterium sp. H642]WMT92024.1 translocation/assembly module TamB domain-containing protein [Pelagibacterium sp. H642]